MLLEIEHICGNFKAEDWKKQFVSFEELKAALFFTLYPRYEDKIAYIWIFEIGLYVLWAPRKARVDLSFSKVSLR